MTDLKKGALLAFCLPLALLAGAYASEWLGLHPCEMCWWQRWAHIYALPFALTANVMQMGWMRDRIPTAADRSTRFWTLVAAAFILASGVIGAYHSGVEYHWWQGHTACTSEVAGGTSLSDMMKSATSGPMVRCDEAQWTLLGISLAGFNAVISTVGAIAVAFLAIRRRPM